MKHGKWKGGWTLVEMLGVLLFLSFLIGIAYMSGRGWREQALLARQRQWVQMLNAAELLYAQEVRARLAMQQAPLPELPMDPQQRWQELLARGYVQLLQETGPDLQYIQFQMSPPRWSLKD